MNRVSFLIDGFNLYHSIVELKSDTGKGSKWIDLNRLFASYIHLFGHDARLEKIFYFSAIPNYLKNIDPDKIQRHNDYIKCLKDTGIEIILGKFKTKDKYCSKCKSYSKAHEEKETDVSIGVKMLDLLINSECNTIVLVTGDSDLLPAIKTCKKNFPNVQLVCIFPYKRYSEELKNNVTKSFSINQSQYSKYIFPDPNILNDSTIVKKPASW